MFNKLNFVKNNFNNKHILIEPFLGLGNKTETNITGDFNQTLDTKLEISEDTRNSLETNFMNDIKNNIKTSNNTQQSIKILASNAIKLEKLKCDDISLGNLEQKGTIQLVSDTNIINETKTSIETDIEKSIKKKMEKQMPDLEPFISAQKESLNNFYKGCDADYESIKDAASKAAVATKTAGIGNTNTSDIDISKNRNVENAIGISESTLMDTVINDENTMINSINTDNKTAIEHILGLDNKFDLKTITCDTLKIGNIKQVAKIDANIKLMVKNITRDDIVNKFSSTVEKIYKLARDNLLKEKADGYDLFKKERIALLNSIWAPPTITEENWEDSEYFVSEEEWNAGLAARGKVIEGIEVASLAATACNGISGENEIHDKIKAQYGDYVKKQNCSENFTEPEPEPEPEPENNNEFLDFIKKHQIILIISGIVILLIIILLIIFSGDDDDDEDDW